MIDGLDECTGDQSRLTDLIMELISSTNNFKVVVASRPWTNFQDTFQGRPHLKLEDLTLDDISRYITSKFEACEGFHELRERDQEYANGLLQAIADKAEGVFLWVHLVVDSLLAGLANGDRMCDLQRRLDGLPPRLEDFFERMLEGLEPGYMSHASQLFQLVRAASISPSLLSLALADLDDRARVLRAQVKPLSREQKLVYCKNMKRKLMSRCRGLLEATTHKPEARGGGDQADGSDDRLRHIQTTHTGSAMYNSLNSVKVCDSCSDLMFTLRVQYLHRTVKDYIEDPKVWKWLISANNDPTFNPHLGWVESYLAQIKGLDPECLIRNLFWENVTWCLDYAKRGGQVASSETEARLLDELNLACTALFLSTRKDGQMVADKLMLEARAEQNPDIHWTATLITWIPRPSFLYLMAMCGMHRYINSHMASTATTTAQASHRLRPGPSASSTHHQDAQNVLDVESHAGDQTPSLLFAATDDFLTLSQFENRKNLCRETPYVETVKVLLRKGENPYVFFNGRSPWTIAKAMADRDESDYPGIVRLYLKHAGPPPVHDPAYTRDRTRLGSGANHNSRAVDDGTSDPLTPENLSQIPIAFDLPNTMSIFAEYECGAGTDDQAESDSKRMAGPLPVTGSSRRRTSRRKVPPLPRIPGPSSPPPSSSSSSRSSSLTTVTLELEAVASPPLRTATRVPHRLREYYPTTSSPDRDSHRIPTRRSHESPMALRDYRIPSRRRADPDAQSDDDASQAIPPPVRHVSSSHRRERRDPDHYPPPAEPRRASQWPTQRHSEYSSPYYAAPPPPHSYSFAPPWPSSVRAPIHVPSQHNPISWYVPRPLAQRLGNPTEFEPGHYYGGLQQIQRHAPMGGYGPGPGPGPGPVSREYYSGRVQAQFGYSPGYY